jgi:hypothetical protein
VTWVAAFALTLAVELPLVLAVAGRARWRRTASDALLANTLTHPLAWCAIGAGAPWLAVEIAVAVVEWLVYRTVTGLRPARALAASLLANGVTAALSFVV